MRTAIVYFGKYPSFNPGAKRIGLYKKGMEKSDFYVDILCPPLFMQRNSISFLINSFLQPLYIFFWGFSNLKKYSHWFVYQPGWPSLFTLGLVAKVTNKKIILELNERPSAPYGNRLTELPFVKSLNRFMMEKVTFRLFINGFVVISEALETLVKKRVPLAKVIRIPVLVDFSYMMRSTPEIKTENPYFIHAGALSDRKDGMIDVFEALGIVNTVHNIPLHLYITSKKAPHKEKNVIESIIQRYNLKDKVHYQENIDEDKLLSFLKNSSFFVINKYENEQNKYNFSTKFGEYLAVGKPIITTGYGEIGNFVKDSKTTILIPQNSAKNLAEAMRNVVLGKYDLDRIKESSQYMARTLLSYHVYGKKIGHFFQELE